MKIVVFGSGLILLIVAAAGILHEPTGAMESRTVYSSEFKTQARATLAAIERLERFSGGLPEFEADKALDVLADVKAGSSASTQLNEARAFRLLQKYKGAIELYHITKADKERRALAALRDEVARTSFH